MDLTRKTAPSALAVTLADAKLNLRIESADTSQDAMVTAWLYGIIGYAENMMHRSIITQTWTLKMDYFSDSMRLPMGPVQSVSSIKYIDASGVQQTLAASVYTIVGDRIYLAYGQSWPSVLFRDDVVEIEYVTGSGSAATDTPAEIKLYILAKLMEQYDPAIRPEKDTVQSSFIDRLLDAHALMGWA